MKMNGMQIQILIKRWKLKVLGERGGSPFDIVLPVPGHVPVCVGSEFRRFIVPVTHLNHPVFAKLLEKAAKECGFDSNDGPLFIPCDESKFEEVLRLVTRSVKLKLPTRCRVITTESMPLLHNLNHTLSC